MKWSNHFSEGFNFSAFNLIWLESEFKPDEKEQTKGCDSWFTNCFLGLATTASQKGEYIFSDPIRWDNQALLSSQQPEL